MLEAKLFINGEWMESSEKFDIINPANNTVIGQGYTADPGMVSEAISCANLAFDSWSALPARKRSKYLSKISDLLLKRKNEMAEVLAKEQGKPLNEALGEIIYSASFFEWYSEGCKRIQDEIIPPAKLGQEFKVQHVPIGVVAAITPWNFPAGMLARKIAPALAAGCTIVVKPASQTPLTAVKFFEILEEIELPAGVSNLILGSGKSIGEQLLNDKRIRKITFTGSTEVGRLIMKMASNHITKMSLELGGHAPFIIKEDANLEKAIKDLVGIKMRNTGQTCVSPNRIYVHQSIYDKVINMLVEKVSSLKIGSFDQDKVAVGPLIDKNAMEHIQSQVSDAVKKGANLLYGGQRSRETEHEKGNFYIPTILSGITPEMLIYTEETFGPIFPLLPFESDEEVVHMANDSNYGLAAYLYSENYRNSREIAEKLEYGTIAINDISTSDFPQVPVGGIKESGIGREGGHQGLEEFTEIKFTLTNFK